MRAGVGRRQIQDAVTVEVGYRQPPGIQTDGFGQVTREESIAILQRHLDAVAAQHRKREIVGAVAVEIAVDDVTRLGGRRNLLADGECAEAVVAQNSDARGIRTDHGQILRAVSQYVDRGECDRAFRKRDPR